MTCYELVFIVRADVPSFEVDNLIKSFTQIIEEHKGEIIKTEYWGIRSLAYPINNNNKGQYVLLGLKAVPSAITEIERRMKLNESIIRFLTTRVNEINMQSSPILKHNAESAKNDVVDVTES